MYRKWFDQDAKYLEEYSYGELKPRYIIAPKVIRMPRPKCMVALHLRMVQLLSLHSRKRPFTKTVNLRAIGKTNTVNIQGIRHCACIYLYNLGALQHTTRRPTLFRTCSMAGSRSTQAPRPPPRLWWSQRLWVCVAHWHSIFSSNFIDFVTGFCIGTQGRWRPGTATSTPQESLSPTTSLHASRCTVCPCACPINCFTTRGTLSTAFFMNNRTTLVPQLCVHSFAKCKEGV